MRARANAMCGSGRRSSKSRCSSGTNHIPFKKTPVKRIKKKKRKSLGTSPHLENHLKFHERSSLVATNPDENGKFEEHPSFVRNLSKRMQRRKSKKKVRSKNNLRRRRRRRERQMSKENEVEMLRDAMTAQVNLLKAGNLSALPTGIIIEILLGGPFDAGDLVSLSMTCKYFEGLSVNLKGRSTKVTEYVAKHKVDALGCISVSVPWLGESYKKLLHRVQEPKVYVMGGWSHKHKNMNTVEVLELDGWKMVNPMKSKRRNFAASTVNGKLFIFGGEDTDRTLSSVECMDPIAPIHRQWKTITPLPSARCRLATATRGHHVFISGGLNEILEPVTNITRYNVRKKRWKTLCDMPMSRYSHASVIVNDTLFVIGGYDADNVCLSSIDCLRLKRWDELPSESAYTWYAGIPMPACSGRVCAIVWNEKILVADGMKHVEAFDPKTNEWEQLPMLQCRRRKFSMALYRGRPIVMGGYDEHGFCLDTVEMYIEHFDTWVYIDRLHYARDALVAST